MSKLDTVRKLAKAAGKKFHLQSVKVEASTVGNKKYKVTFTADGTSHTVHFGHRNYEDFLDHNDPERQKRYLKRATAITNCNNQNTCNLPTAPNFWATRVLWRHK